MEPGGGSHGLRPGVGHGVLDLAAQRRAGQMVKEFNDVGRLTALDPVQDVLVGLGARHFAFGVLRRGEVGDSALFAV